MMLKQRKLDEALRAGASSRHVNVDKLMASTIHTLINYTIEFTPASTSQNVLQDGSLKYILLKPENEPTRKQNLAKLHSKKNVVKFRVQKFEYKQQNNKIKQNTRDKKSIRKKRSKTIKKHRQKKQQQMNKS